MRKEPESEVINLGAGSPPDRLESLFVARGDVVEKDHVLGYLAGYAEQMAQRGKISSSDLKLIFTTDSVDEAIAHIRSKTIEPFGLRRVAHMRRHFPWLGEQRLSGNGPAIC